MATRPKEVATNCVKCLTAKGPNLGSTRSHVQMQLYRISRMLQLELHLDSVSQPVNRNCKSKKLMHATARQHISLSRDMSTLAGQECGDGTRAVPIAW